MKRLLKDKKDKKGKWNGCFNSHFFFKCADLASVLTVIIEHFFTK